MESKIKLNENLELEKKFLKNIIEDEKNHLIFGRNGIGKTSISESVANAFAIDEDKIKIFRYEDFTSEQAKIFSKENKLDINYNYDQLESKKNELNNLELRLKQNTKERTKIIENYFGSKNKKNIGSEIFGLINVDYTKKENAVSETDHTPDEIISIEELNKYNNLVEIINLMKIKDKYNIDRFADENLKSISEEEYVLLLESDILEYLEAINEKISEDINECPLCKTKIDNLKEVIKSKIDSINLFLEKNKNLHEIFISIPDGEEKRELINNFINLVKNFKSIDEPDIDADAKIKKDEEIKSDIFMEMISNDVELNELLVEADLLNKQKIILSKQIEVLKKSKDEKFEITKKHLSYINETISTIEMKLIPNELEKTFSIKLNDRNELNHLSEGEKHTITFILSLVEMMSNEIIEYIIMDDPLTSYDLLNKHNIVFNIIKASGFFKENDRKTKLIILSHDLNIFDLYESQYDKNEFEYWYIEKKCNSNLEILPYFKNINTQKDLSKFYEILEEQINVEDGEIDKVEIHKLLNYLIVKRERIDKTEIGNIYEEISELLHFTTEVINKIQNPINTLQKVFNQYIEMRQSKNIESEILKIISENKFEYEQYNDLFESLSIKNYYISILRQYIEKKLFEKITDNKTKVNFLKKHKLSDKIMLMHKKGYITDEKKSSLMLTKTIANASNHLVTASAQHMLVSNLTFDILLKKIILVYDILNSI